MLAGLRERGFNQDVVERDCACELMRRLVGAQCHAHILKPLEDHLVAPAELACCGVHAAGDAAVAKAYDLIHEAVEENAVARLVNLLRRDEVLLLLKRGGVDVGREAVGDSVLTVEEERKEPHRRAALSVGHLLFPVDLVLAEVDLGCRPVAALPALVEVGVADVVGGAAGCRARCSGGHQKSPRLVALVL